MPGKIFISYRRGDDPGTTGRLFDALKDTFDADRLFLDVDNIEPGLDFIEVIEDRISKSDVLLAVIGEHWIEARDREGRRRLDSPQDSVRIEIESAINQKKRVIPVLIGETKIPEPDLLPESLRVLARRNAATIRHERFHDDMANLTKALRRALGDDKPPPAPVQSQPVGLYAAAPAAAPAQDKAPTWPAKLLQARVPLLACVVAAVMLGGAYLYFDSDAPSGGTVYKPSSLPAPVASAVPPPDPAPALPPPMKIAPAANAANSVANAANSAAVPVSTSPRAPGVKPDWCSEDHLKQDELTICATQSLWALDNQLNDVFRKYSATVSDPKALSDDEAKWVREIRRPCAADQQCITKVYLARIATFNVFLLRQ